MREIIVIAHNIRSTHNIGSLFRTCEGFGISRLIISGFSPYPATERDDRLPHITQKLTDQIHKTALGAETMLPFEHVDHPDIHALKQAGYRIIALEQSGRSISMPAYVPTNKLALILGEEVHGVPTELLDQCDDIIEIPMRGRKESFNVSVSAGMALYHLTLMN